MKKSFLILLSFLFLGFSWSQIENDIAIHQETTTQYSVDSPNDFIENFSISTTEKKATVSWNYTYDAYEKLRKDGCSTSMAYIREKEIKNGEWTVIDNINLKETTFQIEDLDEDETYLLKIGVTKNGE